MKYLLALILLLASAVATFGQTSCAGSTPPYVQSGRTWNVSTSGQSDVLAALTNEQISPQDIDTISIPTFTCTWTGTTPIIRLTIPNSLTIQGAGAQHATSGGGGPTGTDSTVIIDNTTGGNDPIIITTSAGKTYRMTGIYFNQTIANTHNAGLVQWLGSSTAVIFDHNHISLPASGVGIYIGGVVTGVASSNYFQVPANAISNDFAMHNGISPSTSTSNASWSNPANFGSNAFFFIEDNLFSGGNILDGSEGSRYVVRHNNLSGLAGCSPGDCTQIFSHSTRNGERGDLYREIYLNTVSQPAGTNALMPFNSGTGLVWGNTVTNMSHIANLDNNGREDSGTYNQYGVPGWIPTHTYALNAEIVDQNGFLQQVTTAGTSGATVPAFNSTVGGTTPGDGTVTWTNRGANPPQNNYLGYCGPSPSSWGINTASVAAGSTAVTGTGFSTSWPTGSEIIIEGAACTALNGKVGGTCQIASVASTSALTLSGASASPVTSRPYFVGSILDQNVGVHGYACLDQPGRGQGDLMSGNPGTGFTPLLTDTVTSTQTWPNQPLIPIYVWNNTLTPGGGTPSIVSVTTPANYSAATFTDNVDYYQQFGTFGEPGSFNGTAGIGQGSSLPSVTQPTCTPSTNPLPTGAVWLGVSVTGNWGPGYWDTTNSTLYVCTAANTWTAYYTPAPYPSPLLAGGSVSFVPSFITFGATIKGTNTAYPLAGTLSNSTTSTITLGSGGITGLNAADFTQVAGGSCGATLVANTFCTINFQFSPTAAAGTAETATYTLNFTGATGSPVTLTLNGTSGNLPGPALNQFAKEAHDASSRINK